MSGGCTLAKGRNNNGSRGNGSRRRGKKRGITCPKSKKPIAPNPASKFEEGSDTK